MGNLKLHLLWGPLPAGQVIREALPHETPAMYPLAVQQIQTFHCFAEEVPPGWPKFGFLFMNNTTSEKQKKLHPKKLKTMVTLNL